MKKYASVYLALALLVSVANPVTVRAQEVKNITVEETQNFTIEDKIKTMAPMFGAQSIQYALIDDGKVIISGDTGNTTDTLYGVGSVSKMYTTMAVMQLVEKGKIELDKPLIEYIPDFVMADERYKKITPRMLLNHSSGLMGSTFKNTLLYSDNDEYATRELLNQLKEQRLKADPGAYSVYCNDGFTLAEILVERVSGVSFTEYIHEFITKPLGLENTITPREDLAGEKIALMYDANQMALPTEVLNAIGTGGIYATAEDLARLGEVYTGTKEEVLSEETIALTMQPEYQKGMWPEAGDNMLAFGLGWDHVNAYPFNEYDMQALVKGGDTIGYHASLIVLPEEDMVAAVVSTGSASTYNQMIATDMIMGRLQEQGTIKELVEVPSYGVPGVPVPVSEEELSKAGKYGTMGSVLDIDILPEGQLNLAFVGMPERGVQSFIHTGEGAYISADGSTKVSIVQEVNGEFYLRVDAYGQIPGVGTVATSEYQGQKLKDNPVAPEVQKVWEARDGKKYYVLDEKYSSIGHTSEQSMLIKLEEEVPGYVANMMITGKDEARSIIQIPGNYGRDVSDLHFFEKDGVEYLKGGCYLAVEAEGLPVLLLKGEQTIKIEEDGYAKWYKIAKEDAGKVIKVKLPEKASFAIYDAAGGARTFSTVSGADTMDLPEGGTIVFLGDAGSVFKVNEVK
ncbi:MAG: serine hydrolase domain-containing protein [Cellulosilyticaceae bacterium]